MKKEYLNPEIEFVVLEQTDVITASFGNETPLPEDEDFSE